MIAIAFTGVVQTRLFLDSWSALVTSAYGLLVLAKTAGLLVLVAFGAYNRQRVMRRVALLAATILLTACSGDPASVPILTVVITAPKSTIAVGETLQLTAIARDVNGLTLPNAKITYSASPTSVISVNETGLVTGIGPGMGSVTATSGNVTSQPIAITVN